MLDISERAKPSMNASNNSRAYDMSVNSRGQTKSNATSFNKDLFDLDIDGLSNHSSDNLHSSAIFDDHTMIEEKRITNKKVVQPKIRPRKRP